MNNISIGITLTSQSYTPEAYAYAEYLNNKGYTVELGLNNQFKSKHHLYILFMGLDPFFTASPFKGAKIVHEYHSLSTGNFARSKNSIKRLINRKPQARIFLNKQVYSELPFNDDIPFIFRDMGIDKGFFNFSIEKKEYDILYSGSIEGRPGLLNTIIQLAKKRFSILIIGDYSTQTEELLKKYPNIILTGRVSRSRLPSLYQKCEFALNYTPDIYPFNIQTSTKVLEYCAANLKIISNKYYWVEQFAKQRNAKFYWLSPNNSAENIRSFTYSTPAVSDLEWNTLLDNINFEKFILNLCEK